MTVTGHDNIPFTLIERAKTLTDAILYVNDAFLDANILTQMNIVNVFSEEAMIEEQVGCPICLLT
jgi:hypothetical protein